MNKKEKAYQKLDELEIDYKVNNHKAVFTIDEMNEIDVNKYGM